MSDVQVIKDRIRKLLNLGADDGAFDGEVTNAMAAARALMLKHQIDDSDLERSDEDRVEETVFGTGRAYSNNRFLSKWESALQYAISDLVGTVGCYRLSAEQREKDGRLQFDKNGRPEMKTPLVFYGPESDVADAVVLFSEWQTTIATLAVMKHGGVFFGAGRNYAEGFAMGLLKKVRAIRQAETEQISAQKRGQLTGAAGAAALMVLSANQLMAKKKEAALDWLKNEKGIKLRKTGGSAGGKYDRNAYQAGLRDGQRADISRNAKKRIGGS